MSERKENLYGQLDLVNLRQAILFLLSVGLSSLLIFLKDPLAIAF